MTYPALKYSPFPGNNSEYDQNRISLPTLMYYIWDLQPKNKGWRKKGETGEEKKIEEPSSSLIWQMQSRKKGSGTSGGREAHQNEIFCYYISHYADLCQIRGSDWIKLGPEPQNLWKLFVVFYFFSLLMMSKREKRKREKSFIIWLQGRIQFQLLSIPQGASELKRWILELLSHLVHI